jgi:hypothetical protein
MHRSASRPFIFLMAIALQVAGGRVVARDDLPVAPAGELSATVDHPLVPLAAVACKVFQGTEVDEGGERITTRVEETVSARPEQVAGITVTVVTVDDFHDGVLHDLTIEYFAQGADGTVYYVGEWVDEYAHGTIVNHDGAWLSGEQGAQPGVFMPAAPVIGQTFLPEHLPDVSMEQVTMIALDQVITTAAGAFEDCLVTKEVELPLGTTERKTYCPGVGLVREDSFRGSVELVAFEATAPADATRAVPVAS